MCAYRWQLLAALLKVHGRYAEFFAYTFVGMFTNLFVPGLLAGDAARSVYLGRRHGRMGEAIASVVADRGVGLIGLFWLAAFAAIFLNFAAIPSSVITPTVAVGAIALAGFLAAPLVARLIHLMPRPIRRAGGIVAPYLHHPAALIPAIALSIVLQITLALGQYILAVGLGLTVPLSLFILCVPIANVFASLPLTLNGLGIRESAYLLLFGMAGMRKEDAIALGLLWFAITMVGGHDRRDCVRYYANPRRRDLNVSRCDRFRACTNPAMDPISLRFQGRTCGPVRRPARRGCRRSAAISRGRQSGIDRLTPPGG